MRIASWAWLGLGMLLGAAAGPALLAPLVAHWSPDTWRLREVSVLGGARLAPSEISAAVGLAAGARLDRIDRGALEARVAAHPWIRSARVMTGLPPGRLVVAVEEREPRAIALIAADPEGAAAPWWVDDSGLPFAPAAADAQADAGPGAPQLVGIADAAPGLSDPRLAQGVRIAEALQAAGLPAAREIRLGGGDPDELPVLRLHGPAGAIVLGAGELDAKLARLARLLAAGLPEVQGASAIDLRFGDRTILRSGPSPRGDEATFSRGSAGASQPEPLG